MAIGNEIVTLAKIEEVTMLNEEKLKPLASLFITPVLTDNLVIFYEEEFISTTQVSPVVVLNRMVHAQQCHERTVNYGLQRDSKIISPDYNTRLTLVDLLTRNELISSVDTLIEYYNGAIFNVGYQRYPSETVTDLSLLGYLTLLKKVLNQHGNNSNRNILAYVDRIIANNDSQTIGDMRDITQSLLLRLNELMRM